MVTQVQGCLLKSALLLCSCLFSLSALSKDIKYFIDNDKLEDKVTIVDQKGTCFTLSETKKKVCKYVDDELESDIYVQYKGSGIVAIYQYCCGSNVVPYISYYSYSIEKKDLVEFAYVMGASSREMISPNLSIDKSTIEIDYTLKEASMLEVKKLTRSIDGLVDVNLNDTENYELNSNLSIDYFDLLMVLNNRPIDEKMAVNYLKLGKYLHNQNKTVEAVLIADELLSFDSKMHQAKLLKADVYFSKDRKDMAKQAYS